MAGFTLFARWIIYFGILWLIAVWQRWRWFAYIGIAFNLLVAALGLWLLNFSPGWMFAGAIGGLLTFDLTLFWNRIRFIDSDDERRGTRDRVISSEISLLALVGFGLASLAMIVKIQFSFAWALLSAIIAAFAITQLVVWFRKRS